MNDKDKEAFEKWFESLFPDINHENVRREAWLAACCGYKQKEIDNYKTLFEEEHSFRVELFNEFKKLQAENAKLRKCVEFYADWSNWLVSNHPILEAYCAEIEEDHSEVTYQEVDGKWYECEFGGKRARQCLKELEGK